MRAETGVALQAVSRARALADARDGADRVTSKGGIDLVTATDVACEDVVREEIGRAFPAHAIVGEERGGTPVADRPYWLVDPICGTRAFASDLPLYCTNVALVESGEVTVAAVAAGRSEEVLWAERGAGGHWRAAPGEDRALSASAAGNMVWFSGREPHVAAMVLDAVVAARWYVLQFPSTLSYVWLATGRIAGIVHSGTSPVHVAAGCLLAAEAGAIVTDLDGAPWRVASAGILAAATPELHAELRGLVERHRPRTPVRGYDHLAITVADVERTVRFYGEVLGATILYEAEWRAGRLPIAMLQIGANRMNVHPASAPAAPHALAPTPGSVDLCLRWDAPIEDAAALLARHGVEVTCGPDGNLLELLSTVGG